MRGGFDMNPDVPLCVDLDGALLRSNIHIERCLRCVKQDVFYAATAVWWLFRGKARWQSQMARRCSLDVSLLPIDTGLLNWLRTERNRGRRLILCTRGDRETADQVARHIGIFDDVVAGDSGATDSNREQAAILDGRYGIRGYDYVGNKTANSEVGKHARNVITTDVFGLNQDAGSAQKGSSVVKAQRRVSLWIRALRLHQWAKNLLIFVPAVASHQGLKPAVMRAAVEAFIWFGLCASATYVINDLLDLDADRTHVRKRRRPFAAGDIPLVHGIVAAALLLGVALTGALLTLGQLFLYSLLFYLSATLWYSFVLKRIAMVDVLALAGLYTVRVVAGGIAIKVTPSFWLLAFSMFLFFSLAMIKRYTELNAVLAGGLSTAAGRGYMTEDLPLMLSCGVSAGFVSVLVLAMYVNLGANGLYRYPPVIWLLCPVVLYWICRMWRKAHRGELHDDPIVFATTDRPSLIVFAICAALVWMAT